jgi:hypothetical protein
MRTPPRSAGPYVQSATRVQPLKTGDVGTPNYKGSGDFDD